MVPIFWATLYINMQQKKTTVVITEGRVSISTIYVHSFVVEAEATVFKPFVYFTATNTFQKFVILFYLQIKLQLNMTWPNLLLPSRGSCDFLSSVYHPFMGENNALHWHGLARSHLP